MDVLPLKECLLLKPQRCREKEFYVLNTLNLLNFVVQNHFRTNGHRQKGKMNLYLLYNWQNINRRDYSRLLMFCLYKIVNWTSRRSEVYIVNVKVGDNEVGIH